MVSLKLKLPEHFLEGETRCGYYISPEMKRVWAVELDLLAEFMRVCENHHLKFFADGGTLLGAVRHKGMIPWDDDIDVAMMRNEFEKLCEVAPKEFKYPYFFQTEKTDPGSARGHAQIRNSETTGILKGEQHLSLPFNQGIFLDVFPLDDVPDNEKERKLFFNEIHSLSLKISKIIRLTVRYKKSHKIWKRPLKALIHKLFLLTGISYKSLYFKREKLFQKYDNKKCKYVGELVLQPMNPRWVWNKEVFEKTVYLPFEMLTIPAPWRYEEFLDQEYGNWHDFIKGTSVHGGCVFDVNKSYKYYLSDKR